MPAPNIRANCPDCGQMFVETEDVAVLLHDEGQLLQYRVRCSMCHIPYVQTCTKRIIDMLLMNGVAMQHIGPCTELRDADRYTSQPLFTADDVIDFHFEVQAEGAA